MLNATISSVFLTYSPSPAPTRTDYMHVVPGAPLYVIAFVVAVFIIYGVILQRLRDASVSLTPMKFSKTVGKFGLCGLSITFEIAYIVTLLTDYAQSYKGFAIMILLARFLHLPGGCFISSKILLANQNQSLLKLTDQEHLLTNRSIYTALFVLTAIDNTNVTYLPWLSTEFTCLSEGYPNMNLFKFCVLVKIVQSFLAVTFQIVVFSKINYNGGFNELYFVTKAYFCMSIVSATISCIVPLLEVLIHSSLLSAMTSSNKDSNHTDISNPIRIGIQ